MAKMTYRAFAKKHLKSLIKKHKGSAPKAMKELGSMWKKYKKGK